MQRCDEHVVVFVARVVGGWLLSLDLDGGFLDVRCICSWQVVLWVLEAVLEDVLSEFRVLFGESFSECSVEK